MIVERPNLVRFDGIATADGGTLYWGWSFVVKRTCTRFDVFSSSLFMFVSEEEEEDEV